MLPQRPGTPPYLVREATRINALESTVARMASDLSSSKEQINEVKELLLRLINPPQQLPPQSTTAPLTNSEHQAPPNLTQLQVPTHGAPSKCNSPSGIEVGRSRRRGIQESHINALSSDSADEDEVQVLEAPAVPGNIASWASGDTVPWTPNTVLQNFTNRMPIGAAVSTDLSASIGTASHASLSPRPSAFTSPSTTNNQPRATNDAGQSVVSTQINHGIAQVSDGVTTRGMTLQEELPTPRPPRERFELGLLPRLLNDAIAVNSLCYILHPDHGETIVAEGKTGGSWKSPSTKFGKLCLEGQQMVQVHKIIKTGLPLIFSESRHPFTTLDEVLVKPAGSGVYVKWYSKLLIRKPKPAVRGSK